MSKLFPMFKKKGKGKEEEPVEGIKKKRSKSKDINGSPSITPSASPAKSNKKLKVKGRRSKSSSGKENIPSVDGVDQSESFYVDDSGTVREGLPPVVSKEGLQLNEDGLGETKDTDSGLNLELTDGRLESSSEAGNTSYSLTPESEYATPVFEDINGDTDAENCDVFISEGVLDSELGTDGIDNMVVKKDHSDCMVQENVEVAATDKSQINVSSIPTSDVNESAIENKVVSEQVSAEVQITADNDPDCRTISEGNRRRDSRCITGIADDENVAVCHDEALNSSQVEEEDTSTTCNKDLSINADISVESIDMNGNPTDTREEPNEVEKDATNVQYDDCKVEGKEMNELSTSEENVDNNEQVNEDETEFINDATSLSQPASPFEQDSIENIKSKSIEFETSKFLQDKGQDDGRESTEDISKISSSQDSDDDFDSAQEDWDDLDTESFKGTNKVSDQSEGINEAKNAALECKTDSDVTNTDSVPGKLTANNSQLVDDFSIPEDIRACNVGSVVEAVNDYSVQGQQENILDATHIASSNQLDRKLSMMSAASSDIFNEELDDLLDEELDRLSEEETDTNKVNESVSATKNGLSKSANTAPGLLDDTHLGVREKESVVIGGSREQDSLVATPNTSGVGTTEEGQAVLESGDNINPSSEEMNKYVVNDSSIAASESDISNSSPQAHLKSETNTDCQDNLTAVSHLSPDEVIDQARDSGYYSLPVSPKPLVAGRVNEDTSNTGKVTDDSFEDSEEEGMMTPPSEVSTLEDEGDSLKDVIDKSITVISNVDVNDVKHEPELQSDLNENCKETTIAEVSQTDATPSQGPSGVGLPKLFIPVDIVATVKETNSEPDTPERLGRAKSPQSDVGLKSPDPVGDKFLQQAVCLSHDEAEARLAQRRAARAEARELRLRELEKQQQDQENEEEKQFGTPTLAEPSPRSMGGTRTSVGRTSALNSTGQYSRRSSEDSTTEDSALPANIREMRAELKELDEKFRKAMITNAQLDNEKSTLTFEVELLKDQYTELEEAHTQLTKEHRKKCTEYEQLKKVSTKLQEEVRSLRALLQERDQLIQEYGLIVVGEEENGADVDADDLDNDVDILLSPRKIAVKKALVSQEAAELLSKGSAEGSLDIRLKKFGEEKNDLEDQVRRLKLELEEERNKNRRKENGLDYEKQKEQSKTVNEYKFRVQKAEAEVLTLQANVARLDALSTRYKTQSEELEKSEEELKVERRKLQRELRDAQNRLEELETTNNHLIKRFDKLKNARSTLLKDLSQDPA